VRDYFKSLLRHTGRILWGPIERFITIVGGLVGILVVFNQPLTDWLVRKYQGIPWWIGLLILGALLLQAVFRAGYVAWKEEKEAHEKHKAENEELIAESENRPDPIPDTLGEWLDTTPLLTVQNRTFRNDRVELDGFHYANCVFDACTFWFKGTKPFRVAETCKIVDGYNIDASAPQAMAMLVFLKSLGALPPDFEYLDPEDGRPVD
jgi:hypothetical protein